MLYKDKFRSESHRKWNWKYNQGGFYFITFITQGRIPLFGKVNDGTMILSDLGKIAEEEWARSFHIRKELICHAHIIMPDHIHALLELRTVNTHGCAYPSHGCAYPSHDNGTENDNGTSNDNGTEQIRTGRAYLRGDMTENDNGTENVNATENVNGMENGNGMEQIRTGRAYLRGDLTSHDNATSNDNATANDNGMANGDGMADGDGMTNRDGMADDNGTEQIRTGRAYLPRRLPKSISSFIGGYKSTVTYKINDYLQNMDPNNIRYNKNNRLWQRNYHDKIIKDQNSYDRIIEYIINNPSHYK